MNKAYVRAEHGDNYATYLPDGQVIPWKLLPIEDYMKYADLMESRSIPLAFLENEIFKKCVLSSFYRENIDTLRAGLVSTVAQNIFAYSGPANGDELNFVLNIKRHVVRSNIFYEVIEYITNAFPSYKPEDIFAMDYSTLMTRLAQAEMKMIKIGMVDQPLEFLNQDEESKEQVQQQQPQKRDTSDLLEKFYAERGIVDPKTNKPPKTTQKVKQEIKSKPSPDNEEKVIITNNDIKEHKTQYMGHEAEDHFLMEASMVDDTVQFYQDYLNQLKKDGKITIKSTEERKAEAEQRAEKNKKFIEKADTLRAEEDKKLQETIRTHAKNKRQKVKGKSLKRK